MFAVSANTFQPHTWRHTVSIPRPLLSIAIALAATSASLQAEVIYLEQFSIEGNSAAMGGSANGWNLTHAQDDAVFEFGLYGGFDPNNTTTGSVAYLTDATTDDGTTGDAFNDITLTDYDSLDFSFKYSNGRFNADQVSAIRLAVEVGGTLYASTTTATPGAVSGTQGTYSLTFDPTAANWLVVTPAAEEVAIGSAATSDLTGVITAVGIVQTNVTAGITDYDDFTINAVASSAAVPEPSTFAAFALLGPGILAWRRRQNKRSSTRT